MFQKTIGNNWPFGQENRFCAKKHLQIAYFSVHESELPHFGRTWTPGQLLGYPWKLWGITLQTSNKEGQWHQNWAYTSLLNFFMCVHGNSRKSDFLGKMLHTRKFSTGKFFGAATHEILTHSGFRKCSWFGWRSLHFEVLAAQSEVMVMVMPKTGGVTKNQRCDGSKSLRQFLSECCKIKKSTWTPGLWVKVDSSQTSRTKICGVTFIRHTKFASRQILKQGSTSAARNSALKTPHPPLPYIFWTVWTWGFTRCQ